METSAAKLFVMVFLGYLAIEIGISGKLGSILATVIDPSGLQSGTTSSGGNGAASLTSFSSSNTNAAEVTSMISSVFGSYAGQAIAIANCESSLNPNAVNKESVGGSYATGVFQILYPSTWNTTSYKNGNPKDARTNILAAYEIFKRDGYSWREWACARIVGL